MTSDDRPAQRRASAVAAAAEHLTREHVALWWASPCQPFPIGQAYTHEEQRDREAHLARFQNQLLVDLEQPPRTAGAREALQARVFTGFAGFARAALGFEERHLRVLMDTGFTRVASDFARAARAFDPAISGEEIFQAGRNVFTMNGLQLLMGRSIALTPAVFAYSMLYPYSDNLLDDPAIPTEQKIAFNQRFAQRLAGGPMTLQDEREHKVDALVAMIEEQYPPSQYPQVWESLRAIHRAQVRSVALMQGDVSPYEVDVLGISVEKGGASVLADGYLVAGELTPEQARFLYGWGAFLQLADDLQDVVEDSKAGLLTVYSQTARRWPLDGLVYRTLRYGAAVLAGLACFDAPGAEPLKELMAGSAVRLVILAAGRARFLLTREGREGIERHSPFRFWFLDRRRKRLARRRLSLMRVIEAFGDPDAGDADVGDAEQPSLDALLERPV